MRANAFWDLRPWEGLMWCAPEGEVVEDEEEDDEEED